LALNPQTNRYEERTSLVERFIREVWPQAGLGAITVVLAGKISRLGLVIPHMARLLFGVGNRLPLPISALIGLPVFASVLRRA